MITTLGTGWYDRQMTGPQTTNLLRSAVLATTIALFATQGSAQATRIIIGGVPTNLLADWGSIAVAPDASTPNAFFALMPLGSVSSWAGFEPGLAMDQLFGAGNWLRCRMTATDWAYLSPDPCAHLAGNNGGVPYPAPLSLLTSTYDWGPYLGSVGMPHVPIPGVTLFAQTPTSFVQGLGNHWTVEHWQLRTRGFQLNDLWNGCAGSASPTPNFTGLLAARFTFTFI